MVEMIYEHEKKYLPLKKVWLWFDQDEFMDWTDDEKEAKHWLGDGTTFTVLEYEYKGELK